MRFEAHISSYLKQNTDKDYCNTRKVVLSESNTLYKNKMQLCLYMKHYIR